MDYHHQQQNFGDKLRYAVLNKRRMNMAPIPTPSHNAQQTTQLGAACSDKCQYTKLIDFINTEAECQEHYIRILEHGVLSVQYPPTPDVLWICPIHFVYHDCRDTHCNSAINLDGTWVCTITGACHSQVMSMISDEPYDGDFGRSGDGSTPHRSGHYLAGIDAQNTQMDYISRQSAQHKTTAFGINPRSPSRQRTKPQAVDPRSQSGISPHKCNLRLLETMYNGATQSRQQSTTHTTQVALSIDERADNPIVTDLVHNVFNWLWVKRIGEVVGINPPYECAFAQVLVFAFNFFKTELSHSENGITHGPQHDIVAYCARLTGELWYLAVISRHINNQTVAMTTAISKQQKLLAPSDASLICVDLPSLMHDIVQLINSGYSISTRVIERFVPAVIASRYRQAGHGLFRQWTGQLELICNTNIPIHEQATTHRRRVMVNPYDVMRSVVRWCAVHVPFDVLVSGLTVDAAMERFNERISCFMLSSHAYNYKPPQT